MPTPMTALPRIVAQLVLTAAAVMATGCGTTRWID